MRSVRSARPALLAVIAVLATLLALVPVSPAGAVSDAELSDEVDYVRRINELRAANGVRPLVEDPQLLIKARAWSNAMGAGVCGPLPSICHDIDPVGGITTPWSKLGENVGTATVGSNAFLMNLFMGSAEHRGNILDPSFTRIGVGVAHRGGRQYVVHKFMSVPGEVISYSAPHSQRYYDVRYDNSFYGDIEWLAIRNITEGYADRSYRPVNGVTRQAMAAFLYRLAGSPPGPFPNPGFTDVSPSHDFFKEISWLASSGITDGFPDGSFRPTRGVTRQAMARYLYVMAGSPPGPFPNPGFTDVSPSHDFYREISWLASTGITKGYGDGSFRPGTGVKRQAMAAFLHRFDALP